MSVRAENRYRAKSLREFHEGADAPASVIRADVHAYRERDKDQRSEIARLNKELGRARRSVAGLRSALTIERRRFALARTGVETVYRGEVADGATLREQYLMTRLRYCLSTVDPSSDDAEQNP